jgi:hypothetical protein
MDGAHATRFSPAQAANETEAPPPIACRHGAKLVACLRAERWRIPSCAKRCEMHAFIQGLPYEVKP